MYAISPEPPELQARSANSKKLAFSTRCHESSSTKAEPINRMARPPIVKAFASRKCHVEALQKRGRRSHVCHSLPLLGRNPPEMTGYSVQSH